MNVSIIIVNYNTKTLLKQCLKSVFDNTTDISFEVIVVDNSSTDGSQQMIKDEFQNVILIESSENIGFGRANNLGAKAAKGKYLMLLNSDTVLVNNAIKILFDFIDKNPAAGICGGNLFDENKKPIHSYSKMPGIMQEIKRLLFIPDTDYFNCTNKPKKVGYVTGADLMIRSDIFNQLNGFDSDFFMYYEESELTYRVKKEGYKVYSVPQAEIIHLEKKSFSDNNNRLGMIFRSCQTYYKKTHSRLYRIITNTILLTTIISRLIIFSFTKDTKKKNCWKSILKIHINKKLK
ncbi:MAG: glycosyltransferase family 2 protein [Prevotellaceae bacterium]|jgi:GT2 family glycosyltransferase|nr:glycosyltransferase family 2 protein [Prevotellaceae bacterium]